ncbi:hypothetical protein LTR87_009098 [Friedmanniomyces endolithicus]|nr:hypothetical protein LTR87_009098 [Friedmanniomyces endolithicus]
MLAMADTRTTSDMGITPSIRNHRRRRSHDDADHVEGNIGCIYVTADDAMATAAVLGGLARVGGSPVSPRSVVGSISQTARDPMRFQGVTAGLERLEPTSRTVLHLIISPQPAELSPHTKSLQTSDVAGQQSSHPTQHSAAHLPLIPGHQSLQQSLCASTTTTVSNAATKWGNLRKQCEAEYRQGETCGLKTIWTTLPLADKCTMCERIERKQRRFEKHRSDCQRWVVEPQKYRCSIEKAREEMKDLAVEIQRLMAEKHARFNAIGNPRRA